MVSVVSNRFKRSSAGSHSRSLADESPISGPLEKVADFSIVRDDLVLRFGIESRQPLLQDDALRIDAKTIQNTFRRGFSIDERLVSDLEVRPIGSGIRGVESTCSGCRYRCASIPTRLCPLHGPRCGPLSPWRKGKYPADCRGRDARPSPFGRGNTAPGSRSAHASGCTSA